MKTVELNYYVDFGTGDGSDWLDWEVDLTDDERRLTTSLETPNSCATSSTLIKLVFSISLPLSYGYSSLI